MPPLMSLAEKKAIDGFAAILSLEGLKYMRDICDRASVSLFAESVPAATTGNDDNYVGRLQEHCTRYEYPLPKYFYVAVGDRFNCLVNLNDSTPEFGGDLPSYRSKSEAKKACAKAALVHLHNSKELHPLTRYDLGWHIAPSKPTLGERVPSGGFGSSSSESDMEL